MKKRMIPLVAGLGLAALVALPGPANASSGTNSGHAAAHGTLPSGVGAQSLLKVFNQPGAAWKNKTCVFNLSAIPDGTSVSSLSQCGTTISFSTAMIKASVPSSWGTWGSPPSTETSTPDVLQSNGQTSVTVTLSTAKSRFGFEAEPDPFSVHTICGSFFTPGGGPHGSQCRDINGNAGARLIAAQTSPKVGSVTIASDTDFAIARIRVGLT